MAVRFFNGVPSGFQSERIFGGVACRGGTRQAFRIGRRVALRVPLHELLVNLILLADCRVGFCCELGQQVEEGLALTDKQSVILEERHRSDRASLAGRNGSDD